MRDAERTTGTWTGSRRALSTAMLPVLVFLPGRARSNFKDVREETNSAIKPFRQSPRICGKWLQVILDPAMPQVGVNRKIAAIAPEGESHF